MLTAVLVYNFFIKNKYSLQNLFFVHFNHKVRPESDQEELFIKNYCVWTNLICVSKAKSSTKKSSKHNEESLRTRRYAQLQKITKKHKIHSVIFWHNLSDRIESSILNLLRWAWLKWFISMENNESHHLLPGVKIIRPLLDISKQSIAEICHKNNIPYVTDASNYDNETSLRNKLRNKVLPELYKLSKSEKWKTTFENSMLNVYKEIGKLQTHTKNPDSWLVKINTSPYRKSKFAYQRNTSQKNISIENSIEILNQLWIYKNISSAFLNELYKFLSTANSWYKYFQKTYFFIAHQKIYIIQAPKNFRQIYIKKTIRAWKETYRYPQKTDKYKWKTRNQYCITQKIPLFRRNFIPVLGIEGKITKVLNIARHPEHSSSS